MTQLEEVSEFYSKQVHSKEREIENLRAYIARLENSEKRLSGEFARQLREKDRQISRFIRLLKSGKDSQKSRHGEVAELYRRHLASKEKELKRLREHISDLESSEKESVPYEDFAEKERQIKKLVGILKLREEENQRLSEQLDNRLITEKDYAVKIKNALAKKETASMELFESLTSDLSRKRDEAEKLRELAVSQERVVRQLNNQVIEDKKRIGYLEAFLEEKERLRNAIEQNFSQQLKNKEQEVEQLGREIRKQLDKGSSAQVHEELTKLKTKLKIRETETEELAKNFANLKEQNSILGKRLEERQRLFVESEKTYNRIVHSLQEQHEKRIKGIMSKNTQLEIQLRTELEKLKAEQGEKEALIDEKKNKIDEALLQFAETSKKLLELKGTEGFSEAGLTTTQLKEKEAELTKLIKEATEKIGEVKRREEELARREALLVQEQEAVNSELAVLKSAGIEIGRDKEYLKQKILQYTMPEVKEQEPETKPAAAELQQPETVQAPEVEEPVEEAVETPETAFTEKEAKYDVLEILRKPSVEPSGKKAVFKQAKSKAKLLPKPPSRAIKARVERPKLKEALIKQAEKQDAFPEVGGYGELDEIRSIVEIGLQHGDSMEQIRSSLEASGYSKKNIEKAFQEVKKI